jgi:hypothetical protein
MRLLAHTPFIPFHSNNNAPIFFIKRNKKAVAAARFRRQRFGYKCLYFKGIKGFQTIITASR